MASRNWENEAAVRRSAAEIVHRLNARSAEISHSIKRVLADEIGELSGDAQMIQLLGASVAGNVQTIFESLQYEIPIDRVEPPTAAYEYARRLAQRGIPVTALVRAYRIGQRALLAVIIAETRDAELDPRLALDVYERTLVVISGYIDWISQQVVAVYETERDQWLENRNRLRAVRVREILANADIDVTTASTAIRYPLHGTHIGLVLWFSDTTSDDNALTRIERYFRDINESALCQGVSMFIAADRISGWGWLTVADEFDRAAERIRVFTAAHPDAPHVAVGATLPGVEGFRRSHRQAQSARNVAIAADLPVGSVHSWEDSGVGAAALLCGNLSEARLWVRDTLGPLSTDSVNDAKLRETLRVFLREGASYKNSAKQLNLHFNSVKYRVGRAIERRGRPIGEDRLDVELALLICQQFGATALQPERG